MATRTPNFYLPRSVHLRWLSEGFDVTKVSIREAIEKAKAEGIDITKPPAAKVS